MLAEEWAKKNNLKFPPINAMEQFWKDGLKEYYVFSDPNDPTCPVVVHFPLVNKTFKEQVSPGLLKIGLIFVSMYDECVVGSVARLVYPGCQKFFLLREQRRKGESAMPAAFSLATLWLVVAASPLKRNREKKSLWHPG